jgi:hypothetical protein
VNLLLVELGVADRIEERELPEHRDRDAQDAAANAGLRRDDGRS